MEDIVIKQEPTGSEAPKPEESQRPEWLLPKFKTPEDQAKAYIELEKMKGKQESPPSPEKKEDAPQAGEAPKADDGAVKEELAKHKIDFDALTEEYGENNGLKPESYKALEAAGIPKNVVDDYIAGQVAKADAFNNQVYESVGGQETFNAMIEWAKGNMSPADIEAYNKSLDGGPDQAKLAVAGLHANYIKATGGSPNLVGGSPSTAATGYRSFAEQLRDQRDPRYHSDPAFRQEVERKAIASTY